LPTGWTRRRLDQALEALEHAAVVVIADAEGDVLIVAAADPEGELRRKRVDAKHALAIESLTWVSREASRTLAEAARGRLVAAGRQMKGRWVSARPDAALNAILIEAAERSIWIYTDADRERLALAKEERRLQRMEGR